MRIESSVTALSWIPSEAITGLSKIPFSTGVAHYDQAPPDRLEQDPARQLAELESLRKDDRFRFANVLDAWIEVEDGRIVDHGQGGGGLIGSTTMKVAGQSATFSAFALHDLTKEPEVGDGWVRFSQSAGGRTGVPTPRHVNRPPFVQIDAPLAWSTLTLTMHSDGKVEPELSGASSFPRHWVYGHDGAIIAKTGLINFKDWYRTAFGKHSPWGDEDSPALVSEVESALERVLSRELMANGAKPKILQIKAGKTLVEQGDRGDDLFLLLDGVLTVEVDGEPLADLGPGALLGERAGLDGGRRTCTLRAVTRCKVAKARAASIDADRLREVSDGHRREDQKP